MEYVGLQGYQWKRLSTRGLIFYYFKKEEDAIKFKLTWGDVA